MPSYSKKKKMPGRGGQPVKVGLPLDTHIISKRGQWRSNFSEKCNVGKVADGKKSLRAKKHLVLAAREESNKGEGEKARNNEFWPKKRFRRSGRREKCVYDLQGGSRKGESLQSPIRCTSMKGKQKCLPRKRKKIHRGRK